LQYLGDGGAVTVPSQIGGFLIISIGGAAFAGAAVTEVTIGNGVTNIGTGAFSNCTRLASVTLPDSLTDIGNSAFQGCSGLLTISFGNSVARIGAGAFSACTNL